MTLEEAQLKLVQLQVDLAEEDLKKAKSSGLSQWLTPITLATFLSLVGGILVFVWSEIKDHNENFRAKHDLGQVELQNDRLIAQKTQLGVEILTLSESVEGAEKELSDLTAEIEVVAATLEQTYLVTKWSIANAQYASRHRRAGGEMPTEEEMQSLWSALDGLPSEVIGSVQSLHEIADWSEIASEMTEGILKELSGELSELQLPNDMSGYQWAGPRGALGVDHALMVRCVEGEVAGYYDVEAGQHLGVDFFEVEISPLTSCGIH